MSIKQRDKQFILNTYKRFDVVFVKGNGKYLWDDKGKKYLDFFAGISVCNLGHCNKRVVSAINKQSRKLIHVSNHYYSLPQVLLAELLCKKSFGGKVFYSNSGAEANECAIKLARKWAKNASGNNNKYEIITFENSFHGRTMATLSATAQPKFHKGFEPMLKGFKYAKFNDLGSVEKLAGKNLAAIIVEPVQGEGGINIASKEFLKGLKRICNKHGALLVFDEIQTGLGRVGKYFAYQGFGIVPDMITLGKSLGGGLPIGATIANNEAAGAFVYGDHGSTFGGNLVSAAAACEVVDSLDNALLSKVNGLGKYFILKLEALKSKFQFIEEVRGVGLMIGVELSFPGREITQYCLNKGLIINCTQDKVLRFLPPFVINKQDIDKAVKIIEESFKWAISKR